MSVMDDRIISDRPDDRRCGAPNPSGAFFPHVCGKPGGHGGQHVCEREDCRSEWDSADEPHGDQIPEPCADAYVRPHGSTYHCTLAAGHDGLHYSRELGFNWAIRICEGSYTDPGGLRYRCLLPDGHDGAHDTTTGVAWPDESADRCGDVFDSRELGCPPCALDPGHEGYHRADHHLWPDDHKWMSTAYPPPPADFAIPRRDTAEVKEDDFEQSRNRAVELAVRALTPMAGAYRNVTDYGADITSLADLLGGYIRNGHPLERLQDGGKQPCPTCGSIYCCPDSV
jgi:hypothetical protein